MKRPVSIVFALIITITATSALAQSEAVDYFRIGAQEMASGFPDRAIASLEKGVQLNPETKEGWYNLGVAYGATKSYQKEVKAYLKALELDANYANALYNLGLAYLDMGKKAEAVEALAKVVKLDPSATDAWNNLAVAHMLTGQSEEAVEAAKKAMETAPKSAEVRFNMALSMFKLAEIMESSERREPILRKALAVYDEVLALDPAFHRAHYNKAVIHHILGESESEIVEYKKAVQIKADYAPALYNLAAALSATERYEDAIEAWEKYINAARMNADEKTFVENARKEVARLRGQ